tara:strand:- start:367 stop:1293 length:927 start_codon:yes stop_codon:yes gene_type:complete
MNPIIKKISDMSSKNRYLNKYSGDVFSAILILIILFVIYAYFQVQNMFQPIRNDWENQKCKMVILPISGFIRPPAYQSEKGNLEYIADNYKECMEKTSFTILKPVTVPFDIIINGIKSLFISISELGNILYEVIDFLRSILSNIMDFFFGIIKMLIKILMQIMAAIGGFFYKALLIFFVGVLIVKSFIGSTVATTSAFIVTIMVFIGLVVAILAGLYLAFSGALGSAAAAFAAMLIPVGSFFIGSSIVTWGVVTIWVLILAAAVTLIVILSHVKDDIKDMYGEIVDQMVENQNKIEDSIKPYGMGTYN